MNRELIVDNHKRVYELLKDMKSWDYIDTMGLTAASIERFCETMALDVMGKSKDDFVEKRLHIAPSMVGFFYYYLQCQQQLPTQLDYIKFYYSANKRWVMDNLNEGGYHHAFFGRLSRFFPSMLRDIHFYHLLKESGHFNQVLFTLKHDLEAKVDILVEKDGVWYGVQLRTKTRRSNEFYQKKKHRNAIDAGAVLIDLPIDLTQARSIQTKKDELKLYSEYHVKQLLQTIHRSVNEPVLAI